MKACFSLNDIKLLKRELASRLPHIESSHRTEAMARGLGWNTNAALRAVLSEHPAEREINVSAVRDYLKSMDSRT